jgi:hypothetical protein
MKPPEPRRARDLGDVYNDVADRYSGNIERDLAECNIPPDLALDIGRTCAAWAVNGVPHAQIAAALAFHVGLMTGVEWVRETRVVTPSSEQSDSHGEPYRYEAKVTLIIAEHGLDRAWSAARDAATTLEGREDVVHAQVSLMDLRHRPDLDNSLKP